ncbi:MAG: hypothetical protein J2P17_24430 [Mycobacterium sp.]|nr:hypothetical protein [Mycobacterium sp.]
MDAKKIASLAAIAFVIFFIIQSPDDAAKIVHSAWHGVVHAFHGVGDFVAKL